MGASPLLRSTRHCALCDRLADLFPGSSQTRLLGLDRADECRLWECAATGGYALVTQDADFAEMAALYGPPPKVLWLRGGNRPTAEVEALLRGQAPAIPDFDGDPDAACLQLGWIGGGAEGAAAIAAPRRQGH